jgi:DNA modification methylase
MLALGWTDAVCNVVNLDKHEEKKLNVLMNSPAISGSWDDLKLAEILEELKLDDDYISLRLNELEPLDLSPTEVEEDESPEVSSEPPVSKLGEIYQLGRHRVMCGDSTDRASVELLMNGVKADMVFTDPPYGIAIVGKDGKVGAENIAKNQVYADVMGDDTTDTAKAHFEVIKGISAKQIIWGGNYFVDFLPFSPGWIIWDKRGEMTSNNFADGEMAWCSFPTRVRIYKQIWNGMIREGESEKRVHPTQKPINTLADILKDHTENGDTILDGFLGSGSTLIACEQTDRTCYGMELDPKYVDVIRKRYWKFINGNEEGWEDGTTNCND